VGDPGLEYPGPGIAQVVLYAVCKSCTFLRVYSEQAEADALGACPACGADMVVRAHEGRFHSAYVGKVSLDLLATPELGSDDGP
jgi:predicted RNA-binding Zn-ribbon protein involved in translation (DUF1610 family)